MNKFEVTGRLVNLHSGVVVLATKTQQRLNDHVQRRDDGTLDIIEPIQLQRGERFFYDGALTPFNVKHLGNFKPSTDALDGNEEKAAEAPAITREFLDENHPDIVEAIYIEGFEAGKKAGSDQGIQSVQNETGPLDLDNNGKLPDRMAHIIEACGMVDEADMTQTSGPKLAALKAAAGLDDISEAERNEAWQLFQSQQSGNNGD